MFPGLTGTNRSDTLIEMLCGVLAYGIVGQLVIILFFAEQAISVSIGWWIGVVTACFCGYHMWWGLDRALDLEEGDAVKRITTYNMLRYIIIVLIMGVVMVTEVGNPLAAVIGIFGLKAGAYMQPFIHKFNKHAAQPDCAAAEVPYKDTPEDVPEEKEVNV